jgi:glycosyltransferase involved in cell wall biosynthesis
MKILQVHNFYQHSGGEDSVLNNEKALFERYGHEVAEYTRDNHEIKGLRDYAYLLFNTHYSEKSRKHFLHQLRESRPDIVHVHNFFPLITPSVFDACQEASVPVVMTLHNYRIIYPNAYLFHKGEIDERTIDASAYLTVPDAVYRNSVIQTAVVAHMIEYHRKRNTWNKNVSRLITFTEFTKDIFVRSGVEPDQLVIKPNFVEDKLSSVLDISPFEDPYFVYVGRISEEKGIEMLVQTWVDQQLSYPLFILGTGPLMEQLQQLSATNENVHWLGFQPQEVVLRYIKHAQALLFPSIWYEGFPMTIVEAFSLATPVVTAGIGNQASIIKHNLNGVHFKVKDTTGLAGQLKLLVTNPEKVKEMGDKARATYEDLYTPEVNYQKLMEIYQSVL